MQVRYKKSYPSNHNKDSLQNEKAQIMLKKLKKAQSMSKKLKKNGHNHPDHMDAGDLKNKRIRKSSKYAKQLSKNGQERSGRLQRVCD